MKRTEEEIEELIKYAKGYHPDKQILSFSEENANWLINDIDKEFRSKRQLIVDIEEFLKVAK